MKRIISILLLLLLATQIWAQVDASTKRYIRIGSLQSHFTAYGAERAWNNTYYEGLRWPAEYSSQDNSVIKRAWIACEDFDDPDDRHWSHYAVYITAGSEGIGLFPMSIRQSTRFMPSSVYVDGNDLKAIFASDVDTLDVNQIPDRVVTNVVNTSMGLTMSRTVYAFSQQYHDNYFIKIFTYTNTGNTNWDDEPELTDSLKGVRIGWGTRYSLGREGAAAIGDGQSWGKHSWVTRRGEDYALHYQEPITVMNPFADWLRCGFSWAGQTEVNTDFDNIGGPQVSRDGRLTAPHHAGTVVLHVDSSPVDPTDNIQQPAFLGWHAGDTYPDIGELRWQNALEMTQVYTMLAGQPHGGKGGEDRFYEENTTSITDPVDPWTIHGDGGGTNVMITYGPFDLAHGESVTIVEAEGINGISRYVCETVGARWKAAYQDPSDNGPFDLPGGGSTTDLDFYKNSWVMTGQDSILLTFGRAKRNFDSGFAIPQPPRPPANFTVESGGNRIYLSWLASPDEGEADFGGYRIYRAIGKPDTTYEEVFACGLDTDNPEIVHTYDDVSPIRGQSYYYYMVAFNDGTNNDTELNPKGPLHSNRQFTQTTQPATLQRPEGINLEAIRVVPNPFVIKNRQLQYVGHENRLYFLDIPGICEIRIFTERGDLIKTIQHTNGSGDEFWDLTTDANQIIVSGIYIAHFETPDGRAAYRKFIVIR